MAECFCGNEIVKGYCEGCGEDAEECVCLESPDEEEPEEEPDEQ